MRTGSVTQRKSRRNLEDRWLRGMSLTTSAEHVHSLPGLAHISHYQ